MVKIANPPIGWWRTSIGEEEIARIVQAVRDERLGQGPITVEFEEALAALLGVPHVVCTTSGTVALTIALLAAGVRAGDEVIIPNRTWVATANSAVLLGAQVRLVDVQPSSMVVDPDEVESAITSKTKAIIPVHLNGRAADMGRILTIARERGITVIEDACQALCSQHKGQYLGTFGRFGCFSLGVAKLLTTSQGGFVVCHSDADWNRLRQIRNNGLSGSVMDEISDVGVSGNFKYIDLLAAIGLGQLKRLEARIERQRAIYQRYQSGLDSVRILSPTPKVDLDAGEIPFRAEFLCMQRRDFIAKMAARGITVITQSPNLNAYPHLPNERTFPHAQIYSANLVTLPSGPEQPLENIDKTIEIILDLDR